MFVELAFAAQDLGDDAFGASSGARPFSQPSKSKL
jgi:hypothetical protein